MTLFKSAITTTQALFRYRFRGQLATTKVSSLFTMNKMFDKEKLVRVEVLYQKARLDCMNTKNLKSY